MREVAEEQTRPIDILESHINFIPAIPISSGVMGHGNPIDGYGIGTDGRYPWRVGAPSLRICRGSVMQFGEEIHIIIDICINITLLFHFFEPTLVLHCHFKGVSCNSG